MSQVPRSRDRSSAHQPSSRHATDHDAAVEVDPDEALDLLDDDYARELLQLTAGGARPARELIDRSSASKPTVYRRLNRLEDAGLVEARTAFDPDGHHHQVYRATIGELTIALVDGDVRASAAPAEGSATAGDAFAE
jgi:DNA-binding transcriptional ArsR family regulator